MTTLCFLLLILLDVKPPTRISRQLLYRHYLEQWSYDNPSRLWLELDYHTGREPHVIVIHLSTDP
jgi:hypothetical protein